MPDSLPILVLVSDLIFSSKISAQARASGTPIKMVRPATLADEPGRMLIADLNQPGAIAAAAAWQQTQGKPVVGFVSHVDAATIAQARAAGLENILARSRFVQILPDLLGPASA